MQHIARTSGVANLFVQIVPAFLKWASFSFILGLLKQTKQFLKQNNVQKCPSSIWYSNSLPLEHEHLVFRQNMTDLF